MNKNRRDSLSSIDINSYDFDRDGSINMPVQEALYMAERLLKKSDDMLVKQLINAKAHAKIRDTDDHGEFENSQIRTTFLGLNFALNKRELVAPIFRPQLFDMTQTDSKEPKRLINAIYSLDQQLIDIHWVYCRALDQNPETFCYSDLGDIWDKDYFFAETVEQFIQQHWTAPHKANILAIPEQEQILLNKLKTSNIAQIQYRVKRTRGPDRTAISTHCIGNRQFKIFNLDDLYDDLLALRLAKNDITQAVRIKALMTGHPLDVKQTDSAKRSMRRRLIKFRDELKLIK